MLKKWIIRILTVAALAVFLYSVGNLLSIRLWYRAGEKLYSDASENYTQSAPAPTTESIQSTETPVSEPLAEDEPERAPIVVDFQELQELNGDIFAWIYCEDSVINYPVAHCDNNDFYLDYGYDRKPSGTGTIFSDAGNRPGVQDWNIIIYGHHMQNKTMFASLKNWFEQDYYDAHPVMWLLTPEQDYRIDLYSVRSTPATSDTYTIFYEPDEQFEDYILRAKAESGFTSDVEPDPQLHHVLLSTCAYSYYNERTVIHGQLVPVASAGGLPIPAETLSPGAND